MAKEQLGLKVDAKLLRRALRKFPERTRLGLRFALESHGDYFQRQMHARFTGKLGGTSLDTLANRTGSLRRTFAATVLPDGRKGPLDMKLVASMGSARTKGYVFIQEYGGTVTAKRAKYLTIPLPSNLTAAGRVRFQSPRDITDPVFVRSKKGALLAGRSVDGEFQALWVLKKSVKIPARLGLRRTWRSARVKRDRTARITNALRQAIGRSGL